MTRTSAINYFILSILTYKSPINNNFVFLMTDLFIWAKRDYNSITLRKKYNHINFLYIILRSKFSIKKINSKIYRLS